MGNKTTATATASSNKAERAAIGEVLEAKVADMGKFSTATPKGGGKNQGTNRKGKKDQRRLGLFS